jgi:hypothetical protein
MENQTKMRIIEVIDNFIKYMLTEQDGGTVIYQHLLEQTEENLDDWVNDKFKNWLGNENEYTHTELFCNNCGYDEECECEVKEPVEDEFTISSMKITRYIDYIIDREVEKQMEGMEFPEPPPRSPPVGEGPWKAGRITARGCFINTQRDLQEEEKTKFYDNIFSNCREMLEIIQILKDFYEEEYDIKFEYNYEEFMIKYCYLYIYEMEATDLKEYIINLIDPVEPK